MERDHLLLDVDIALVIAQDETHHGCFRTLIPGSRGPRTTAPGRSTFTCRCCQLCSWVGGAAEQPEMLERKDGKLC